MSRDRGVCPGILDRHFKSADPEPGSEFLANRIQKARQRQARKIACRKLDAIWANKPLKPPGRK